MSGGEQGAAVRQALTDLDRLIGKLRRLAALAPDGKRVFGFATILQEIAEELATVQSREKGESNMREPQAEVLADLFQQLELALYGKFGNTWEVQQMRRVEAVLQSAIHVGLQPAQATIQRLEEELESERQITLNDPAEQRAERYAAEAAGLTETLIATEARLTAAQATIPPLQALVQRWREGAANQAGEFEQCDRFELEQCADELAAALRSATEKERP